VPFYWSEAAIRPKILIFYSSSSADCTFQSSSGDCSSAFNSSSSADCTFQRSSGSGMMTAAAPSIAVPMLTAAAPVAPSVSAK